MRAAQLTTNAAASPRAGTPSINVWRIVQIGAIGILILIVLVYFAFPFYWMLKSAFQTNTEIMAIPTQWVPSSLSFQSFERALALIPFGRYITNSLFVSVSTTLVAITIASMAAYVLARFRFPGATVILVIILFSQLIPGITRVFPIYFLIQDLGLLNNYLGLILAYIGFSVPYAVLMLRGYFKTSCPEELEEAALIDGCNYFTAFVRVVLPVSRPGIAAIAIFTFLGAWNDFLWASLLLNRGQMKTIQVGLGDFVGEMSGIQSMNAFMAACLMATIPAILLFALAQHNIVGGISAGAIKG